MKNGHLQNVIAGLTEHLFSIILWTSVAFYLVRNLFETV